MFHCRIIGRLVVAWVAGCADSALNGEAVTVPYCSSRTTDFLVFVTVVPIVLFDGGSQKRHRFGAVDAIVCFVFLTTINEFHNLPFGKTVIAPSRINVRMISRNNLCLDVHGRDFELVEWIKTRQNGVQVVPQAENVNLFVQWLILVLFGGSPL